MEVTPAELNVRSLDMFAEVQRAYSSPRLTGSREEPDFRAQEPAARGNEEARGRGFGAEQAQDEPERKVRLIGESVVNIRVAFHVDGETGDVTIKVIDNATGEVVRYIPPEELMSIAQKLREFAGFVVDKMR